MSNSLCFVDCETTGLVPQVHEPWEIAIIARDEQGADSEHVWYVKPAQMAASDARALQIGGFYQRSPRPGQPGPSWTTPDAAASSIARMTAGAHLVGANVAFDAAFLERLLHRNGAGHAWSYHLVDVEALAAGFLGAAPPWSSADLSAECGVPRPATDRHTALGDARWARDLYDRILRAGRSTVIEAAGAWGA